MELLIFAVVVIIVAALFVVAVDYLPFGDAKLKQVAKFAIIALAALAILVRVLD